MDQSFADSHSLGPSCLNDVEFGHLIYDLKCPLHDQVRLVLDDLMPFNRLREVILGVFQKDLTEPSGGLRVHPLNQPVSQGIADDLDLRLYLDLPISKCPPVAAS